MRTIYPPIAVEEFPNDIAALWIEAHNDLRQRRNQRLIWMVPVGLFLGLITLVLSIVLYFVPLLLALIALSIANGSTCRYTIFDRDSYGRVTGVRLGYDFNPKYLFLNIGDWLKATVSSPGSFLMAIVCVLTGFLALIFLGLFVIVAGFEYIGEMFWLTSFENERQNIRSARVVEQMLISGPELLNRQSFNAITSPVGSVPTGNTDFEDIPIFDGQMILHPDGSFSLKNGLKVDPFAIFSEVSFPPFIVSRNPKDGLIIETETGKVRFRFEDGAWSASG